MRIKPELTSSYSNVATSSNDSLRGLSALKSDHSLHESKSPGHFGPVVPITIISCSNSSGVIIKVQTGYNEMKTGATYLPL